MNADERRRHDAGRSLSHQGFGSACYAPFNSLYLHTSGRVTACCVSTHVLGNVGDSSLTEIWHGAQAGELRQAVRDYDFSRGCNFCQWQVSQDDGVAAFATDFDPVLVLDPVPEWPKRIEFELSNTCNLECVMCNGDLSSTIRSRRERRPRMPRVYDDAFFADLRSFLPHLEGAVFLGGEPFLAAESFRVWDLMVELGLATPCSVVTNGTYWNARIERVLDALPVSVTVSLDGATEATFERIRVGASFTQVMDNVRRFRAYTSERGTDLRLAFCLMADNWHEFGDLLLLADSLDASVRVNTVTDPVHGLAQLPTDELAPIVAALDARDGEMTQRLSRNRAVWDAERARLAGLLAQRAAATGGGSPRALYLLDSRPAAVPDDLWEGLDAGGSPVTRAEATQVVQEALPGAPVSVLYCDDDHRMVGVGQSGEFLGMPGEWCVGRSFAELGHGLQERYGTQVDPLDAVMVGGGVLRRAVHRAADGAATYFAGFAYACALPDGSRGSATVAAASSTVPAWAPVTSTPVAMPRVGSEGG